MRRSFTVSARTVQGRGEGISVIRAGKVEHLSTDERSEYKGKFGRRGAHPLTTNQQGTTSNLQSVGLQGFSQDHLEFYYQCRRSAWDAFWMLCCIGPEAKVAERQHIVGSGYQVASIV